MPRSRRFRKNQDKPEWGKNNPQTKAKNRKMLMILGALVIVIVVISAFVAFTPGLFSGPAASPTPSPTITPTPTVTPYVTASPAPSTLTSPAGEYSADGTQIILVTSMGNITIQLRDDKPITSGNFKSLVERNMYDDTIFHRVIAGFMIQGGEISGASIPTINDEIGTDNRNVRGTIAMAKTTEANSASSSFFINTVDNGNNPIDQEGTKFDTVYTVFGKVIQGMDVVDAISNVPVTTNSLTGENSQPIQTVTLIKAIVLP